MTDFNLSEQYTLSVRVDADGLAFSVFNPLSGEETCEDWPVDESLPLAANLRRAFETREWLGRPYRQVYVLAATPRFTLMPLELFEDEQAEAVFYFNHPRRPHEEVRYDILHRNNLVVLYGVDRSVCDFVQERWPGATLRAQVSPLLDLFAEKSRQGNTRKMYVQVHRERTEVFCYDGGRLLLCNSYPCTRDEDRAYYLLCAWNTLGFDQERDELHLCGRAARGDDWVRGLGKFVRRVFVAQAGVRMDFLGIRRE